MYDSMYLIFICKKEGNISSLLKKLKKSGTVLDSK